MLDVLLCHDLTDFSDRGLKSLVSLKLPVHRLHVVCVLPRIEPSYPGVVWPRDEDEPRREHALGELKLRLAAYDPVLHVVIGEPGARIVDVAEQTGVHLIALPTHGRTGLSRLVGGSVAEHVSRFAPCPVLVVPPGVEHTEEPEWQEAPPLAGESPGEMVDALAVQVCERVESQPGWLTSITVSLPPDEDAEPWIRRIEARLAMAGIEYVDILTTRRPGPLALLHLRFEEA